VLDAEAGERERAGLGLHPSATTEAPHVATRSTSDLVRTRSTGSVPTPVTMLRSSLMTSGWASTMCRSEEIPAPTSSCASAKHTSGARPHSCGKRLNASTPIRRPLSTSTIGCSTTCGPPASMTGPSRSPISACSSRLRRSGSMMSAAAWDRTSISALSRLDSCLSAANPAAQNVPYTVPSLSSSAIC
jgi:hypothetical protein